MIFKHSKLCTREIQYTHLW